MSNEDYLSPDYDPFEEPGPSRQVKSGPNWTLIIGIVAGVAVFCILLCCGGLWFVFDFGMDVVAEQVQAEIEDNPVIQEHIGNVTSLDVDFTKSVAIEGDDIFVFRIEGSKGSGVLTVESITEGDSEEVVSGELKMDSGETFDLFPDDIELPTNDPEIGEEASDVDEQRPTDGS